jgi:hypothetical protein
MDDEQEREQKLRELKAEAQSLKEVVASDVDRAVWASWPRLVTAFNGLKDRADTLGVKPGLDRIEIVPRQDLSMKPGWGTSAEKAKFSEIGHAVDLLGQRISLALKEDLKPSSGSATSGVHKDENEGFTAEQIKAIERISWRSLWKLVGVTSVLTVCTGITIYYKVYNKVVSAVSESVEKKIIAQFDDPTISKTVERVAGEKGKEILQDLVQPEIQNFNVKIAEALAEINEAKGRILGIERDLAKVAALAQPATLELVACSTSVVDNQVVCKLTLLSRREEALGLLRFLVTIPEESSAKIIHLGPYSKKSTTLFPVTHPSERSAEVEFTEITANYTDLYVVLSAPSWFSVEGNRKVKPHDIEAKPH